MSVDTNDRKETGESRQRRGRRSVASYVGWAIVVAVAVFVVAGLATQGISLGGAESAVSDSGGSEAVDLLKLVCPLH